MPSKIPYRKPAPETIYPSSFYDDAGIARCPKCGEQKRTIPGIGVICPQKDSDCPMTGGDSTGSIQPAGTVADPLPNGDSTSEPPEVE